MLSSSACFVCRGVAQAAAAPPLGGSICKCKSAKVVQQVESAEPQTRSPRSPRLVAFPRSTGACRARAGLALGTAAAQTLGHVPLHANTPAAARQGCARLRRRPPKNGLLAPAGSPMATSATTPSGACLLHPGDAHSAWQLTQACGRAQAQARPQPTPVHTHTHTPREQRPAPIRAAGRLLRAIALCVSRARHGKRWAQQRQEATGRSERHTGCTPGPHAPQQCRCTVCYEHAQGRRPQAAALLPRGGLAGLAFFAQQVLRASPQFLPAPPPPVSRSSPKVTRTPWGVADLWIGHA